MSTETTDHYAQMFAAADRNLASADRNVAGDEQPADYYLARAAVRAQLATAAAIREQTAVFRELLAEDKAAADELRKTVPCGNPSWLHDSADCPCKTKTAGV